MIESREGPKAGSVPATAVGDPAEGAGYGVAPHAGGPARSQTEDETGGPCLIAIVGDSGSGKSTVADAVVALLGPERVTELHLDDYHRYTREERAAREMTALHPAVHDLPLMHEHLRLLRQGRPIRNRTYNHADGSFGPIRAIEPREVVVVRGLLGFPSDELQELYHLSVFLQPEPELLFRWKLRRDVQSRGYTEAEVLKNIVQHLLDSKEFVLPQAGRADVVVRYELPASDAPDDQIRTSLLMRRKAAELARQTDLIAGLGPAARQLDEGKDVCIELGNELTADDVDRWARTCFPETYAPQGIGSYTDDAGVANVRPPLAGVEVLIARLATMLRCPGGAA
jgi:uridine kinase